MELLMKMMKTITREREEMMMKPRVKDGDDAVLH